MKIRVVIEEVVVDVDYEEKLRDDVKEVVKACADESLRLHEARKPKEPT